MAHGHNILETTEMFSLKREILGLKRLNNLENIISYK
jgi:hypothetical protein